MTIRELRTVLDNLEREYPTCIISSIDEDENVVGMYYPTKDIKNYFEISIDSLINA